LAQKVSEIEEIEITQPVQTNGVFTIVPVEIIKPLRNEYFFYIWNAGKNEVRWMTSFDTTVQDVEQFVITLKRILKNYLT